MVLHTLWQLYLMSLNLRLPSSTRIFIFIQNMVSFHNLGALLGRLSPRCSDPHPAVRTAAVDCIYSLLYIQLRYEGTETESVYLCHFILFAVT